MWIVFRASRTRRCRIDTPPLTPRAARPGERPDCYVRQGRGTDAAAPGEATLLSDPFRRAHSGAEIRVDNVTRRARPQGFADGTAFTLK